MADITITVTEVVDAVSAESTPTTITVTDGVFVDSGAGGGVESVVAGTNVTVDSTDPANPIVSATGGGAGGGTVDTVVAGTGISVNATDPANPIVTNTGATSAQGTLADTAVQPGDLGTAAAADTGDFDAAGAAAAAQAASQPLDSDLTAIAALTTTSFGRALLALADAAATRTAIGAGTSSFDGAYASLTGKPTLGTAAAAATGDFDAAGAAAAAQAASQPLDSDLTAIAALTTTSFGRAFLALADAAAGRSALALGTAALISSTAGGDLSGTLPSPTVTKINGTALSGLATGLLKNTTSTGVPSIAVAADIPNIAESQVTNLVTDLAAKAPLASPTFTGTPAAPTASAATNTTQVATTAFVQGEITAKAPLASPTFTGNPLAPTPSAGDNDTSIATTAFVTAALTKQAEVFVFALGDETTAITTGTAKVTWRCPFAFTVTGVRASLTTSSSSGIPTVDINEGGTTILSTKLTIDASELTSTTAATAAVISDSSLADDAEITFDIDVAGTGAKGLKVSIYGTRT